MSQPVQHIMRKSVHASTWLLISSVTQKLLNLATFFVLVRFLKPEDYGVMSVVFVATGFLDVISTPGFERALMQRSGDAEYYIDVAWTFKFFRASLISFCVFLSAPFVANFFHISEYVNVLRWSAILPLIGAPSNLREIYIQKSLDFKKIFYRDTITQIVYIIVAIMWVVFVSPTVWALLIGHIARYATGTIISYMLYPAWPRFSFSFSRLTDLFGYSKWIIGQNILDYFLGIFDSVYVGRFMNVSNLGLYTKARDLAYAPAAPFVNAITRVGFPAYVQIQDRLVKIQEGFLKTFTILSVITPLVFLIFFSIGDSIVRLLLGPAWLGVVVPLKILSASIVCSSLVILIEPLFDAIGRPEVNFKIKGALLVSFVILLYPSIRWGGMFGMSVAVLICWFINLLYTIFLSRPILKLSFTHFRATVTSIMVAFLSVIVLVFPVVTRIGHVSLLLVVRVGLQSVLIIGGYVGVLWIMQLFLPEGPIKIFWELIHSFRPNLPK